MRLALLILAVASLVLSGPNSYASGGYVNRLPAPGAKGAKEKLDREKFGLGQKVFNTSIKLDAKEPAKPQLEKLKALQVKLPESVATKKDLTELAGRLTAAQLDALDYFIMQRYPAK